MRERFRNDVKAAYLGAVLLRNFVVLSFDAGKAAWAELSIDELSRRGHYAMEFRIERGLGGKPTLAFFLATHCDASGFDPAGGGSFYTTPSNGRKVYLMRDAIVCTALSPEEEEMTLMERKRLLKGMRDRGLSLDERERASELTDMLDRPLIIAPAPKEKFGQGEERLMAAAIKQAVRADDMTVHRASSALSGVPPIRESREMLSAVMDAIDARWPEQKSGRIRRYYAPRA
jgi:hypothetical protein